MEYTVFSHESWRSQHFYMRDGVHCMFSRQTESTALTPKIWSPNQLLMSAGVHTIYSHHMESTAFTHTKMPLLLSSFSLHSGVRLAKIPVVDFFSTSPSSQKQKLMTGVCSSLTPDYREKEVSNSSISHEQMLFTPSLMGKCCGHNAIPGFLLA